MFMLTGSQHTTKLDNGKEMCSIKHHLTPSPCYAMNGLEASAPGTSRDILDIFINSDDSYCLLSLSGCAPVATRISTYNNQYIKKMVSADSLALPPQQ